MNTPVKLLLGAIAAGCIAVGVAAQTGTLDLARPASHTGGQHGAVQAQQATASPTPQASPSPSPSPQPSLAPAPQPVVEAAAPAKKKKKHGGED